VVIVQLGDVGKRLFQVIFVYITLTDRSLHEKIYRQFED